MGAGTYRPDRAIPGGIASIVPSLRYRSGPLELSAIGVYSDAPAGRWNFQGGTAASVATPALGIFQLEAMGQAEWTSHYRVRGTTLFTGGVRAYLTPGSGARAWLGRYYGQASSLGTRRPLQRSEFGGSARLGSVHLEFSVANTTVDRSLMFGPDGPSRRRHPHQQPGARHPEAGGARCADRRGALGTVADQLTRLRRLAGPPIQPQHRRDDDLGPERVSRHRSLAGAGGRGRPRGLRSGDVGAGRAVLRARAPAQGRVAGHRSAGRVPPGPPPRRHSGSDRRWRPGGRS